MNVQTPLSSETPTYFYPTEEESDKTDDPVLHFTGKTRKRKEPSYGSRILHSWTFIHFILVIVSLVISCSRGGRLKTTGANGGRRLASGLPGEEEESEESAILEGCLDMLQATGTLHQPFPPLPGPEEAIAQILSALTEDAPGSLTQGGALGAPLGAPTGAPLTIPASEETGVYAVSPQPGPSRDEGGGLGTHAEGIGEGAYGHASEAAGGAWGSLSPTRLFPSSQPYPGVLQPGTLRWQMFQPGPPAHPVAGPSLPASRHQGPAFSTGAAAAGEGLGVILRPPEGEPAAPAKVPRLQQVLPQLQPKPKKHVSGWKKRKPSASAVQGFPEGEPHARLPVGEQPQELSSEELEIDPFLKALQAVPESWSPEPLDLAELQALSPEEREQEEGESVPQGEGHEAGSEGLQASEEEINLSGEMFVEIEEAPLLPTSTGSPGSPEPSTSQVLRGAAAAFLGDPLPGPSGLVRTAAPAPPSTSADDGGGGPQAAPPGVSPRPAHQMPRATHLFYRLPVVLPGKITKKFSVTRAFFPSKTTALGFPPLAIARSILTKPEITGEEADKLIETCEVLVARILHDLGTPIDPHGPSRAVDRLGRIFLYMDAVVSVIQLLGPQMEPDNWWPQVASRVFQETVYMTGNKAGLISEQHAALATRLSTALQTLKTRNRLGCDETVQLKRDLLCKQQSTKDFRDRRWDPWRDDDANSQDPAAP